MVNMHSQYSPVKTQIQKQPKPNTHTHTKVSQHVQPQQIVHLLQVWKIKWSNEWEKSLKCSHALYSTKIKSINIKTMTNNNIKEPINGKIQLSLWNATTDSCPDCLSSLYKCTSGPELPPNHLAASCAPHNCSPRSALTWEDWLQAAACSSREQAWRRALGGNNFTPDPPLPRPQHELRTGFREREEKHCVNQRRETGRRGRGRGGGQERKAGRRMERVEE